MNKVLRCPYCHSVRISINPLKRGWWFCLRCGKEFKEPAESYY